MSRASEPDDSQETRPKKGEPITIPIPKRGDFLENMKKVAPPATPQESDDEGGAPEK